jgi:indole-3-glycerol phosphate synthase
MSFIDGIVANTVVRVADRKARVPVDELRARLKDAPPQRSLHAALSAGFGVIAEHKRRSPSGGPANAANLARAYETYRDTPWVVAVSVLTDEDYFGGKLDDLTEARARVGKPILRKDFIVDEYQIYEARAHGADVILLMASGLWKDPARIAALYDLARSLDLDVLVELGATEKRIEDLVSVVPPGTRLWGINARSFAKRAGASPDGARAADPSVRHELPTDLEQHRKYRSLVPAGRLAVAESGIHTAADLRAARDAGYHGALIGTAFLGERPIDDVVRELRTVFE